MLNTLMKGLKKILTCSCKKDKEKEAGQTLQRKDMTHLVFLYWLQYYRNKIEIARLESMLKKYRQNQESLLKLLGAMNEYIAKEEQK